MKNTHTVLREKKGIFIKTTGITSRPWYAEFSIQNSIIVALQGIGGITSDSEILANTIPTRTFSRQAEGIEIYGTFITLNGCSRKGCYSSVCNSPVFIEPALYDWCENSPLPGYCQGTDK